MRNQFLFTVIAVAAVAGCGSSKHPPANTPDMAMDVTPAPVATMAGVAGQAVGLSADSGATHVAYLLNPVAVTGKAGGHSAALGMAGELHLTDSKAKDVVVATNVFTGCYQMSPDGAYLLYSTMDPANAATGAVTLSVYSVANATSTVVTKGGLFQAVSQVAQGIFVYTAAPFPQFGSAFTPSGKYYVTGVSAPNAAALGDLAVIELATGKITITRPGGSFVYSQVALPDDTIVFPDTVGGTVPGMGGQPSPEVQTLFWQPASGATAAAVVTTRSSVFAPTADGKHLIVMRTNGDLYSWDATTHTLGAAPLATGIVAFALGSVATGPIAYVGADRSVHVTDTSGAKLLDLDATTANADGFGQPQISPDGGHVYFFQNVSSQDGNGTLMHAAIKSGSAPNKIGAGISVKDLNVTDSAIVYLQNVVAPGQMGDLVSAALDGSSPSATLATGVPTGGLQVINPALKTWVALNQTAATFPTNAVTVGSATLGALSYGTSAGGAETMVDTAVGGSQFELSDDLNAIVYVSKASFYAAASAYVGSLSLVDTKAPGTPISANLVGVWELTSVSSRAFFVNAPAANPAGVYYVKY